MKDGSAFFYVLFSPSLNKYYTGITTEDIHTRVLKHNTSYYGTHYTSSASDWELRLFIHCETYNIARKTELYVKRMKSRKFIEKIINDSEQRDLLIKIIKGI